MSFSLQFLTFPLASEPSSLTPIAGAIIPDKQLILINIADDPRRQMFTIAHELGHWLLHKELLINKPETGILFRHPIGGERDPTPKIY